jgi:hypothetical protein
MKPIFALAIFAFMVMLGCQPSRPPVVKTDEATVKEVSSPPLMVQDNDPTEIAECVNKDLASWNTYLRAISKDCKYDAKLDANIIITSYRIGATDGWYAGSLQATKMKMFGLLGFSEYYTFSNNDVLAIRNALMEETEKENAFAAEAEQRKEKLTTREACVNSEVKTYLYDLGYNCSFGKTLPSRCKNYRESFMKVCQSSGEENCPTLLVKSQPEFCKQAMITYP